MRRRSRRVRRSSSPDSLGVIAALHAAQQSHEKIAGAFLVAPPSDETIREIPAIDAAFLPIPRARLPFPAVVVGSSDDPYADPLFPRRLAEDIGGLIHPRRRVRAAMQRLLQAIHFNGRLSIIVQNGRVLKSGYEEGYFRQPESEVTARLQ